ncbi:MAG: cardiolipin synthase [Methanosarcinaceae archaeon]|nr:cardiolipin synthase [Methanosarcinaceae archaeon]
MFSSDTFYYIIGLLYNLVNLILGTSTSTIFGISVPTRLISFFYILVYFTNSLISFTIIFIDREKPKRAISWLLVFMLFPFIGLIVYLFLGRRWKSTTLKEKLSSGIQDNIKTSLDKYDGPYSNMVEMVSKENGLPVFLYNEIEIFKDGTEKFESLLKDIDEAKHHIHLEYYIAMSDKIGRKIFDRLIEKSKSGVKVRVVLDKFGSRNFSRKYIKEIRDAGVELLFYTAYDACFTRIIDFSLNHRNHRKIVVIDGVIGYLGGNNISDNYIGLGNMGYWRDTHIRVRGELVAGLQALFLDDFYSVLSHNKKTSKWELDRKFKKMVDNYGNEKDFLSYFPENKVTNYLPMQMVYIGPGSPFSAIEHLFLKMISEAEESIYITTPYFVPSDSLTESLKIAINSGVSVNIIFPGQYDHSPVGHACITYLKELLDEGANIYFYDKDSYTHDKTMLVDSKMFTVGSSNFDVRSFYYNFEVNAVVYDEKTSKLIENNFKEDIAKSKQLTLEEYNKGSKLRHFLESFFRLFSLLF